MTMCFSVIACSGKTSDTDDSSGSSISSTSSSSSSEKTEQGTSSSSENISEGMPSTEIVDVDENREFLVGDTVQLKEDGKTKYELTINSVSYTDKRDEYTPDPGCVVVVNYTYKNVDEDALLIDDMRFQLMKPDESVLYESYYFADIITAEVADKGKSCTAEIAYSMNEKQDDLVLTYRDTVSQSVLPIKVVIDLAD